MRTFALLSLPWLFFRTQSMVDALTLLSWLRAGWDSLPALLGWLAPLVLPLAYLPLAEGLDGAYHLLRSLPRDKLGRLAGAFPAFAGQKFSCFVQGAPPPQGVYRRDSFNGKGDVSSPLFAQNVMPPPPSASRQIW